LGSYTTTSKELYEALNLDRDLPTTAADVAAQRRLRVGRSLTFEEYLEFLANFEPPPSDELRGKRGPRGERAFELPP
jgi:hypothetical protein